MPPLPPLLPLPLPRPPPKRSHRNEYLTLGYEL
jgi:hypothetical protein